MESTAGGSVRRAHSEVHPDNTDKSSVPPHHKKSRSTGFISTDSGGFSSSGFSSSGSTPRGSIPKFGINTNIDLFPGPRTSSSVSPTTTSRSNSLSMIQQPFDINTNIDPFPGPRTSSSVSPTTTSRSNSLSMIQQPFDILYVNTSQDTQQQDGPIVLIPNYQKHGRTSWGNLTIFMPNNRRGSHKNCSELIVTSIIARIPCRGIQSDYMDKDDGEEFAKTLIDIAQIATNTFRVQVKLEIGPRTHLTEVPVEVTSGKLTLRPRLTRDNYWLDLTWTDPQKKNPIIKEGIMTLIPIISAFHSMFPARDRHNEADKNILTDAAEYYRVVVGAVSNVKVEGLSFSIIYPRMNGEVLWTEVMFTEDLTFEPDSADWLDVWSKTKHYTSIDVTDAAADLKSALESDIPARSILQMGSMKIQGNVLRAWKEL